MWNYEFRVLNFENAGNVKYTDGVSALVKIYFFLRQDLVVLVGSDSNDQI